MKYTVTHSCGHEADVQIYGSNTHGERDSKIAYHESRLCAECYAKQQAGGNVEEVEMLYREYKANYSDCKTKADSYDKRAKTIIVYVPREIVIKEPAQTEEAISDAATEVAALESIIATAEAQASIPTKAEHAAYLRRLNNLYNEGGEGYLPSRITREQYEQAKARLSELAS